MKGSFSSYEIDTHYHFIIYEFFEKMELKMSSDKQKITKTKNTWSIETTPNAAKNISSFTDFLAPKTSVYVTFLPGSDVMETVQVAERLNKEGMKPIPHLAARSLLDRSQLDNLLGEFVNRAAVDEVLIIAGGVKKPIGDFANSMAILKTGLLQKHGIKKIGVAGHPEGSPDINDLDLSKALFEKNDFAVNQSLNIYIVTQFCFEASTILDWEKHIRLKGIKLPIRVGIPGPASTKALFRFAKLVGTGNSIKFLTKQARNISKLLTIQSPDNLLSELSTEIENDPDCLIENFHFYTFGGFAETASYADLKLSQGRFVQKDRLVG